MKGEWNDHLAVHFFFRSAEVLGDKTLMARWVLYGERLSYLRGYATSFR